MTRRIFNVSQPIVFANGTMQYSFRDFISEVDSAINNAAVTAFWGSLGGSLSNQTDLQAALDGKATTAQGALADTALQPSDNISELTNDAGYLTSANEVPAGGTTGQVLSKVSGTDYDLEWSTPAAGGSKASGSWYTSTGGVTSVSNTATTLVVATERNNSGDFSLASNELTINKTGDFLLTFDCYFNTSGNSRSEYSKWMEVDTGSGYSEAAATRFVTYQRGYDSGQSATLTGVFSFTSGDKIRFRVQRTDGSATTGYQDDNGTRLTVVEV